MKHKDKALFFWMLSAVTLRVDAATTSPEAAQAPINVDVVMDYGFSALLGSTVLSANGESGSFGNYTAYWSYYNSCPTIYYSASAFECKCNGGENLGQSQSLTLSFGNQYPQSGSPSFAGGYSPQNSYISQTVTDPLSITYAQINSPTTSFTENGINYLPGDVLYSIFNDSIASPGTSALGTAFNPVIFNLWNVTGTKNYSAGRTGNCISSDKDSTHNASIDDNIYGDYVYEFNGNANGGAQPSGGFSISIPSSSASSNNITFPPPPNGAPSSYVTGLQLSSSAGSNTALAMPATQGQADNGSTYPASITFNTNSVSAQTTFTLGATVSQQTNQTTQSGSYSSTSSSYNQQQSLSINDVNTLSVAGEYAGVTASDVNTLTTQYNTAFQQSYSSVSNVAFAQSTQTNTASSSSIEISVTYDPATETLSTTPASGSGSSLSTNSTSSSQSAAPGYCYTMTISQEYGPAYLDASSTTWLGGNYGNVGLEINSTTVNTNPSVFSLANFANNFEWWDNNVASSGSGSSSSISTYNGVVAVPNTAQLQSNTESALTLNIYESECTVASSSSARAKPLAERSVKVGPELRKIAFITEESDYNNLTYTDPVNGIGLPTKKEHGFWLDDKGKANAYKYVLSQEDDFINASQGANFIVAGNGNDIVNGGGAADTIIGGSGRNALNGGAGPDTIYGGPDFDNLIGGDGNDVLVGSGGIDHFVPGSGINKIYADSSAQTWIDGLNIKDKITVGTYSHNKNGALSVVRNASSRYILSKMSSIGFAELKHKSSGKVVGVVRTANNFLSANQEMWSDVALVNVATLPKRLFSGISPDTKGLQALSNKSLDWYLESGFKKGSSVYRFSDWQQLRTNPKALSRWINKMSGLFGKSLTSNQVASLTHQASKQDTAAGFVKRYFSSKKQSGVKAG